jgi:hypothetical protein
MFNATSTTKYSDIVKNIEHKFKLYSGPFSHYHGEFTVKGKERDELDSELHNRIIARVNIDIGTTATIGQTVTFKPDGVTLLGDVEKCYVQIGSQPTILRDLSVKVLEKAVLELRKDIDHLKSSIAAPMRYRQLIEKKRCDIWKDYGTMFTETHPDSVAESTRFLKLERRRIKYTHPKSWCEFLCYVENLIFVEEKSTMLPTYWSILEGGEEGDYNELSKAIHSLPSKEDFLRSVHPTGSYADLFADIYGITVEDCLAKGIGVEPETDSGIPNIHYHICSQIN